MRRLFTTLACALLAAGCAYAPAALTQGEWRAEVTVPAVHKPVSLLVHVAPGTSWKLLGLAAHGLRSATLEDVRADADGITFRWPLRAARHCALRPIADGGFAGNCSAAGEAPWRMRLEPPSRAHVPLGITRVALENDGFAWRSLESESVRMHGPAGADLGAFGVRANDAIAANAALLGASGYEPVTDIFLVDTREELQALAGMSAAGFSDPLAGAIVLTRRGESTSALRHELMHVMSVRILGEPSTPWAWLLEGIATHAGGECAGRSLHDVVAYMKQEGMLLPLATLLNEFHQHSDLVTYLQAGSFTEYLVETHGAALFRDVWARGLDAAFRDAGLDTAAEESRWLDTLRTSATAGDWARIRSSGCG
jgi:hypothetical protein